MFHNEKIYYDRLKELQSNDKRMDQGKKPVYLSLIRIKNNSLYQNNP
jgi:hypothetical protein